MVMRPIQIETLWNKFKGKFGWTILQPEEIMLIPSVQPVTQIDDMLNNLCEIDVYSETDTQMSSEVTVPKGKKWDIICATAERSFTGVLTLKAVDPIGNTEITLAVLPTGTYSAHLFNPYLALDEDWKIKFSSGNGTSGLIKHLLMYKERSAF